MSIGYKFIKEKHLNISVWDGKVTLDEWLDNLRQIISGPDFPTTLMQIADLRSAAADPSIDERGIKQAAELIGTHTVNRTGKKIAIVAGKEFKRSKMFENLVKIHFWNAIVFNDLSTACTWLGIDTMETQQEIEQIRIKLREP